MPTPADPAAGRRFLVVVKGYPRLSETFVAQELKGLEDRGLRFDIWSLRRPYDDRTHPVHAEIRARVFYLPEYLREAPLRVLRGLVSAFGRPGFSRALGAWLRDLGRDFSANRFRRFGQACVLAAEADPGARFVYAHFLHTPGSVARYAAMMRGLEWGFSAHARDIWITPDWEKAEKIADARFGVTCTGSGAAHLLGLDQGGAKIARVYHGLDLRRFPAPDEPRPLRQGSDPRDPLRILSVGRLVEKKGYRDLLAALSDMPKSVFWRLIHIGGGPLGPELRDLAGRLGVAGRVEWRGKADQTEVLAALRDADLFALAPRVAQDGDRDGLPNVLLEAASQKLATVCTRIAAAPEFVIHEQTGLLVRPGHVGGLTEALLRLARNPVERLQFGEAARARLEAEFGAEAGLTEIARRIGQAIDAAPVPAQAAVEGAA
jgi:glycosyltransferase involved in cell wall biosynthesis